MYFTVEIPQLCLGYRPAGIQPVATGRAKQRAKSDRHAVWRLTGVMSVPSTMVLIARWRCRVAGLFDVPINSFALSGEILFLGEIPCQ